MAPVRAGSAHGVTTPEAYAVCRAIARREAKNFYWSFRVLPAAKSDAMCAVYAFMRRADDLTDDETLSLEERRRALAEWMTQWQRAGTPPTGSTDDAAIFAAVRDTQRRFGIADALLSELVEGVAMDLDPRPAGPGGLQSYETFDELRRYCYLVASVVGLVSIRIFGYTDGRAETYAEETGVALQLTNILRDVKEDTERGRLYVPLEMLEEFEVSVERIRQLAAGSPMRPEERALLATLGIRAEQLYRSAGKLIPLLDRDSRAAMWVLATIYHRLLNRIAAHRMEVFRQRIQVPGWEKLWILVRGLGMAAWNRVLG